MATKSSAEYDFEALQTMPLTDADQTQEKKKLGFLDTYLSLWIFIACGVGLGLGQLDGMIDFINVTSVESTNILVAIGLILMMYPPLAKVKWEKMSIVFSDKKLLGLTIFLNWVLGPFLMYLLAIAFFGTQERYSGIMSGLSLVGCARCIAMVLVWNDLSGGDPEYCAAVVALNSIITIGLYSPYAVFFIDTLPNAMGFKANSVHVDFATVAENVAIYMGIPFVLALITYASLTNLKGGDWYFKSFAPHIGPITLFSLLFTIIILFASKSRSIFGDLPMVIYAAIPLLVYFAIMYTAGFFGAYVLGADYGHAVTIAFTAASNNFELALAIAIASFTLQSDEALMSVIGALIEIPTMLSLVNACLFLKTKLYDREPLDSCMKLPSKPSVIVLCTGNSARSHLGESLLRMSGQGKIDVYSAGSKPSGVINPFAIQVMSEEGYDMIHEGHRSKSIDEFKGKDIDVLITVCGNADQACPRFKTQKARYHWGFDDPSHVEGTDEEKLAAFRRTRDLMKPIFSSFARDLASGKFEPTMKYDYQPL